MSHVASERHSDQGKKKGVKHGAQPRYQAGQCKRECSCTRYGNIVGAIGSAKPSRLEVIIPKCTAPVDATGVECRYWAGGMD
jgi:hypothetical protein